MVDEMCSKLGGNRIRVEISSGRSRRGGRGNFGGRDGGRYGGGDSYRKRQVSLFCRDFNFIYFKLLSLLLILRGYG